jgi:hypothetical protein
MIPPIQQHYAAAEGCGEELNDWCRRWCPGHQSPLVARRIVPTAFNALFWWGCYPTSLLNETGNGTRLLSGLTFRPRDRFCGSHSRAEKGRFMTPEQRHLIRTWRACRTARRQNHQRSDMSDLELTRLRIRAFLASNGGTLSGVENRMDGDTVSGLFRVGGSAAPPSPRALPPCTDGSAYASVLVTSKWGNTYISKVGSSDRGGVAASVDDQLGLQASLLVTLIFSIRYHERSCRRPYVLLAGSNVSIPPNLQRRLNHLSVSVWRIETLSERVPSLNKLYAFLLTGLRKVLVIDSDALVLKPLDHLFDEARGGPLDATRPERISMAHHAYDTEQAVCGMKIGGRVNGGLVLLRPNESTFESLLPRMWQAIGCHSRLGTTLGENTSSSRMKWRASELERNVSRAGLSRWARTNLTEDAMTAAEHAMRAPRGANGCFKNEQTAFACYYHKKRSLSSLECHEFYDHGLHAHGNGSGHHTRCKKTRLEMAGFSNETCDEIARHVDRRCAWEAVARNVTIVHFKGKGKPWKHIKSSCMEGMRAGQYRHRRGGPPLRPHEAIVWHPELQHCTVTMRPQDEVVFASGAVIPRICCVRHYLAHAEWFSMAAMAGLTPPQPIW